MVWPHLEVFWLSKDNYTGFSERLEKIRQNKGVEGTYFANRTRAAEDRTRRERIILKLSMVSQYPLSVTGLTSLD